jgi:2-keto-3-deoxy-L-rhamnonate aldolase RhmA
MFCPHTFNVAEATYPTQADKSLLVIVQIESRKAIENVEAIAAVPGLDVLFIGTLAAQSPVVTSPGGSSTKPGHLLALHALHALHARVFGIASVQGAVE